MDVEGKRKREEKGGEKRCGKTEIPTPQGGRKKGLGTRLHFAGGGEEEAPSIKAAAFRGVIIHGSSGGGGRGQKKRKENEDPSLSGRSLLSSLL